GLSDGHCLGGRPLDRSTGRAVVPGLVADNAVRPVSDPSLATAGSDGGGGSGAAVEAAAGVSGRGLGGARRSGGPLDLVFRWQGDRAQPDRTTGAEHAGTVGDRPRSRGTGGVPDPHRELLRGRAMDQYVRTQQPGGGPVRGGPGILPESAVS